MENFGSLNRPVTITISGEKGSGKAVLGAFIAEQIEALGAITDFDIVTENSKMKASKETFWNNTVEFVKNNRGSVHFNGKTVHIVIED